MRRYGEVLRYHKDALGKLVSLEAGKILSEGLGEVQEIIDICDLAVGLSRQLFGKTIASERPGHRLMEVWHPIGLIAVVTAFNFPVAVWSWNTAISLVCGNPVIWKPSEKTPLTAVACTALAPPAGRRTSPELHGLGPGGDSATTTWPRRSRTTSACPLVSATGSTRMGGRSGPGWRPASAAACWSSEATTP